MIYPKNILTYSVFRSMQPGKCLVRGSLIHYSPMASLKHPKKTPKNVCMAAFHQTPFFKKDWDKKRQRWTDPQPTTLIHIHNSKMFQDCKQTSQPRFQQPAIPQHLNDPLWSVSHWWYFLWRTWATAESASVWNGRLVRSGKQNENPYAIVIYCGIIHIGTLLWDIMGYSYRNII